MSDTTGERTEKASPRKIKEARRKGSIGTSRDLGAWIGVAAAAATFATVGQATADAAGAVLLRLRDVIAHPEPELAVAVASDALDAVVPSLAPMLGIVVVAAIASVAAQGGIHLRMPQASLRNFNLVNGVKRMFGLQALWEGGKGLLKTAVIGLVLFAVVQSLVPVLMSAGRLSLAAVLDLAAGGITLLLQAAVVAGLVLALVDVFVVHRRNRKHTYVTKKEARDEHKNTDGDPLIKSQRRSRQLAMSRNRMIAAVGGADVVLLNPTHLAVAVTYEPGKSAPRVVAKGADHVATRIREKAAESGVPMIEDKPLARAIYAACEVGQEIPVELYTAVARLLAFVAALTRRGSARGVHRPVRSFSAAA
jgi:Flagellar biosynthesis pathway, component FlhB